VSAAARGDDPALLGLLPAVVAVAAVGVGILRNKPVRRWPWVLVATATGLWAVGDAVYALGTGSHLVAVVVLLYLVGFVGLAAALLRLRHPDGDRLAPTGLLDTAAVTLLLVLLIWVTVIAPASPGPWSLMDPSLVGYLIGDALIVAIALRLAIVGPVDAAVLALIGTALATLVGDLAHSLTVSGVTIPLVLVEVSAASIASVCLGFAAFHPSMARRTVPETDVAGRLSLRRFWVVALATLAAPVVLFVEAFTGEVRDGVVLALLGAALTLVGLARVAAAGDSQSRSLAYRTRTDTLTGLANRSHLLQRLAEGGPPAWSALLLVDLDQFRQLNDAEGPSAGDQVLVTLGARLRRLAGPDDVVARFGGDEFAILVGGLTRGIDSLTADVVAATKMPVPVGARPVVVSACVGVALAVPDIAGDEMVRRAGLALRAAKALGPGEWCRYDLDRHELLIERLRLRESLHRAVDEGAFHLSYQPIVALGTGATVGFEALVRWAHPTQGIIGPSEFITAAEETGLIEAIGDLVLRTAVAEVVGWSHIGAADSVGAEGSTAALTWPPPANMYISVNVSPRQLRRPGFAERVEEALTASRLAAQRLTLELTESVLTKGTDHVWAELAVLRDMGVRLAIDDFGTGFSSLSYLEQTPIDVIKLDKSFVESLAGSERQQQVVASIVSMAHTLGLEVVAEGIEGAAERDLLVALGCLYGQGYLYSRPLTSTEVVAWLTRPPGAPQPRGSTEEEQVDVAR
jgi:diguanylate cyclase (GGDEF)-like protein